MDFKNQNFTGVVGLDLSLTSTGFYCLASSGPNSGTVLSTNLTGWERVDRILYDVLSLCSVNDLVLIENNAFNAIGSAKSKLAALNGIVEFALWRRQIPVVLVAPTTLKKFILGKGNGEKSMILREVFRRYGLEAGTDDEADACDLAHIGACLTGREEPANQAQRDIMTTLTTEKKKKTRKLKVAA